MDLNFGGSAPYTIGIEEEFQLVAPSSFELVPAIEDVLADLGHGGGAGVEAFQPPPEGASPRRGMRGKASGGGNAPFQRRYRAADHGQRALPQGGGRDGLGGADAG